MDPIILSYRDFENLKSHLYNDDDGTPEFHEKCRKEIVESRETLPYCLCLMYIMNHQGRNKAAEKGIYEIACFLDAIFGTNFHFRYDYDHSCPYGYDSCSQCGPSEYTNCTADAPMEYLYQTKEQVNTAISEECSKRNLILADYLFKAAVQEACNAVEIRGETQQSVLKKFVDIWDGGNYEVTINYDKQEPFFMVLQKMLEVSGCGQIRSGFVLGEHFDPHWIPEEKEKFLEGELKLLKDQLESGSYKEIERLFINTNFPVKSMIMKLISTMTLSNGEKLADRIRLLGELPPNNYDYLMEVRIPLQHGYIDWCTAQSIWRINQELRPNEEKYQWTVDKNVLDILIRKYNSLP